MALVWHLLPGDCRRLVCLRRYHRTLASTAAVGFHCDEVSAADFSDLHQQRRGQRNACATFRFRPFLQANRACNFMSFAIAAVILGALSPVTLFVLYNAPLLGSANAIVGHSMILLTHVFAIAFAGIMANRRLLDLLRRMTGRDATARAVLFSWLGGNLFLGAQLAWNLRPFIGSPVLTVQFLRHDPLRGNFYEAVWRAFQHLFF